jgi:pyruvate/2-oxoglutarate dehydrogenase complex dihydrolipoamide acyltransferase (E2) component
MSDTAQRVEIVMPQLGISVAEATLIGWRKQPGDEVERDEPLADISCDKVDSDIPAPASGRLLELLIQPGDTVDVGTPIAILETNAKAPRVTPVVQRLAEELGVDLTKVTGTGNEGRIRREDIEAAAKGTQSKRVPPAQKPTAEPYLPPPAGELSVLRRQIATHMRRSLDAAATVTSWIEVDFAAVEQRRRELGVTALPIVAAATAATLGDFGDLNAWLEGDAYTRHSDVNLGIAVSLGDDGLIVPVIRAAQLLGVEELAQRIKDLATRAREHRLSPDEVAGGTFTITNPGQFGTVMATAIINQPQVGILDVEAVVRRPVVVDGDGGETIAIRPLCLLGLSFDHRALDGAYAARFLAALRDRLQAV